MKNPKEQVGGSHYNKMKIQPVTFIMQNDLSYAQGNVIKYVCRYMDKNGIEDLQKAKQYIDFMINEVLEIEEKIDSFVRNGVTCGDCGEAITDHVDREEITCHACGFTSEPCDFPDND